MCRLQRKMVISPKTYFMLGPPAGQPLPQGTVVNALPEGCTMKVVDGVEYHHDGTNYYRAAFQGNQLVYVTAQP